MPLAESLPAAHGPAARHRLSPQLQGWAAAWCLLVVLIAAEQVWNARWNGPPYGWRSVLIIQSVQWGVWTLLLPGVVVIADRIGVVGRSAAAAAKLAALAAGASVVHAVMFSAVMPTLFYGPSLAAFRDVLRYRGAAILPVNALVCVIAIAAVRAYRWSELARESA
ncbi:MAG TPA: hypothetical protein VF541_09740, partial [Longimicrobium sp.]